MVIDLVTPDSPGWMLQRLWEKLVRRRRHYQRLYDRYAGALITADGEVFTMDDMPPAFARFWAVSHTNFAEMVVKAPLNRMALASIRTSASVGQLGDADAWDMCRRAGLQVALYDALRHAKIAGSGYLIVGKPGQRVVVTPEDPRQVVTIHDPLDQSRVLYGAKFFHDEVAGMDYAYLHTPGKVRVAKHQHTNVGNIGGMGLSFANTGTIAFASDWDWDDTRGGFAGLDTGLDLCAIKRLRNEESVGEFERHVYLLDRIDHMVLQTLVIATMQAFKQRAIKLGEGVDLPDKDPKTGEVIDYEQLFTSSPDKMWKLPHGTDIWESATVDMSSLWTGIDKFIQQLSAVTFTPLSMFAPEGQNQSAEGASLAREGLVAKTEKAIDHVTEDIADVAAMIFQLSGDTKRADRAALTIDWKPVERYGLTEKWTAGVQAKTAGLPWRSIMSDIGQYTPAEISRMESERTADALLAQATMTAIGGTSGNSSGNPAQHQQQPAQQPAQQLQQPAQQQPGNGQPAGSGTPGAGGNVTNTPAPGQRAGGSTVPHP